ncbi:hypothetical protein D3C75_202680 [compost metagenome]
MDIGRFAVKEKEYPGVLSCKVVIFQLIRLLQGYAESKVFSPLISLFGPRQPEISAVRISSLFLAAHLKDRKFQIVTLVHAENLRMVLAGSPPLDQSQHLAGILRRFGDGVQEQLRLHVV